MALAIETDDSVQRIPVVLFFDKELDPEDLRDRISEALQAAPGLCDLVAAYELVSDGFGRLVPDPKPLA
jgi:hypothetical protein